MSPFYWRSFVALTDTFFDEFGFRKCKTCGGVRHPPPKADWGGNLTRCQCGRLLSVEEVLADGP